MRYSKTNSSVTDFDNYKNLREIVNNRIKLNSKEFKTLNTIKVDFNDIDISPNNKIGN